MQNKSFEQAAFVLHTRPFKENQQLVELLTEQQGKVSALVYVGQSKRSIKKGLLQPFLPLTITFKNNTKFESTLKNISQVETSAKSFSLSKNSLYSAFYINELLVRLLSQDIHCDSLFKHYHQTLKGLSQNLPIAPQLRQFELCLLDELGVSLDFTPVFTEDSNNVVGFYYITEQGFTPAYHFSVPNITTAWFDKVHLKIIAEQVNVPEIKTESMIENGTENGAKSTEVEHTFKLLMRQIINELLDGKPLNSRKLFVNKKNRK